MKALFFPGCTVPVRNLNYELASRKTAEAIGLELIDEPAFQCCGFPLKALDATASLTVAARNLALAGKHGLDTVTLCSACAASLAEAVHQLDHDDDLRAGVNRELAQVDLEYKPGVRVFHYIRYLVTEVGLDALEAKVTKPLTGFRFSPHYGCHYVKPSIAAGRFDDPIRPQTLDRLIRLTGAESVDDPLKAACCGGGLLGFDEEAANTLTARRLQSAVDSGADAVALICPFCNVMLEGQQKKIGKQLDLDLKTPVVFYPQLLGLAFGLSPDELGFKMNRAKPKTLIKAFESE